MTGFERDARAKARAVLKWAKRKEARKPMRGAARRNRRHGMKRQSA